MALLDAAMLLMCAWLLIGRLNVIACLGERLVLTVFGFGLLKSLELFLLLALAIKPGLTVQAIVSVAALAGAWALALLGRGVEAPEKSPPVEKAPPGFLGAVGGAAVLLTAAALVLNFWFPVTAPDGVWYQVRAWDFLHEGVLDAPHAAPLYRQYPPCVPLLFAWVYSAGWPAEKALFPVIHLTLVLLLFFRVRAATRCERLAGWMALILASTPYFWWHSLLGLLNLTAGAFFALGGFYLHALIERVTRAADSPVRPWAVLAGTGFGAAAWTRPEFVPFTGIALVLLMQAVHRFPRHGGESDTKILWAFVLPALGWPTLWCAALVLGVSEVQSAGWAMAAATGFLWGFYGLWAWGLFRASTFGLGTLALAAAAGWLALMFLGPSASLTPWGAIGMGLFRTLAFHGFFGFTCLLAALAFTVRWRRLDTPARYLLVFLGLYLAFHFGMHSLLPLKFPASSHVILSPVISPGDAVNSHDTREYLAWYPVFLLWVSLLPKVRRAFGHE